ncbi:MAG: DUF2852 domain-containing protein [bacterium]
MSCTHWSNSNNDAHTSSSRHNHCCKGHWSGMNIAAMVVGFIIFPPLGLVVLLWTLAGRPINELPGAVRDKWNQYAGGKKEMKPDSSDNVVFKEYQQTQYDRINELKEEIRSRAKRFAAFRSDAARRKDQEEFDAFMSSAPSNDKEQ